MAYSGVLDDVRTCSGRACSSVNHYNTSKASFATTTKRNFSTIRYGKPEEIDQMALFLASDEASYCIGGIFVSDGGVTIS